MATILVITLGSVIYQTLSQQQKLTSNDIAAGDDFGSADIAISKNGNYAVVGAIGDASFAGAAYVFLNTGGTWAQQDKLVAGEGQDANDLFGISVDINEAGDVAIVGASSDDANGPNAGAAYVFTRSGSSWSQQQKIDASDGDGNDGFGVSVALNAAGDVAIVGANTEDAPTSNTGAAYTFTESGGTWTEQQKLSPSPATAGDQFGDAVSLDDTGTIAAVGARNDASAGPDNAGAVYFFTESGGTWSQQDKVTASDAAQDDSFGSNLCELSGDGSTALIGAFNDGGGVGAAYVFTESGGSWTEEQKLTASDGELNDDFGLTGDITTNGNVAIVGAYMGTKASDVGGQAYMFSRSGTTWTEEQILQGSDTAENDQFSRSAALNTDGTTAIVGAPEESGQGAIYIFDNS